MPGHDLPDLDRRLRRLPASLAVEPPSGLAERIGRRGRRRRRLRHATAAAVVVVLLGGVIVTRAAVLDTTPTPVLDPGLLVKDATPAELAGGRWRALPPMPPGDPARRFGSAVVWTGRELVVWGGASRDPAFRARADGAAYDPRTGRWAPLPPAPEGQWHLEADDGVAVWTGREVLVWGGLTAAADAPSVAWPADGVAYDPARRSWRRLPAPPLQLRWVSGNQWAVWTGRELMAGGVEAGAGGGVVAGAYDPAADRWRMLPRSPTLTGGRGHLQARTAMWAGTRLLVWNFWSPTARTADNPTAVADHPDAEPDGIDLWAYDPAARRWTVLPAPPDEVREVVTGASMVWTGREVIIASTRSRQVAGRARAAPVAGRYDPERARWAPIAPPPSPGGRTVLALAGAAVVQPMAHAVYDPVADRWLRLPAAPERRGAPPLRSAGLEPALLWVTERATGAIQVHVLVPHRPAAGP